MVHGWAAGNAHWMFVLKRLSAHFRVFCVETYGCGRSERLPFRAKTALETVRGNRFEVTPISPWGSTVQIESPPQMFL